MIPFCAENITVFKLWEKLKMYLSLDKNSQL